MSRGFLLLLTACGAAPQAAAVPVEAPAPVIPDARFVVVTRDHAYFATATAGGVTTTPPMPFPQTHAQEVAWVAGHDPVIRLGVDESYGMMDEDVTPIDSQWDGRIAHLTAKGIELYPETPAAVWPTTKPINKEDWELEHYERPWWAMAVTPEGAVWQGRCEWGHNFDGGACTEWFWTRVDAPDGKVVPGDVKRVSNDYPLPKIAPSSRVKLTIAPIHVEVSDGEDPPGFVPNRLLCTGAGSRLEYPPLESIEGGIDEEVVWISTEPPLVRIARGRFGLTGYTEYVVLAGCEVSEKWESAQLVGGPDELAALYTDDDGSVRRGGREIGKLPGARFVRFAPR